MNKKITIIIMLLISLILFSGCEVDNFKENYTLYKNKEENENSIAELEKDMKRNNEEVKIVFDTYETNKSFATKLNNGIKEYLKSSEFKDCNINTNELGSKVTFEYNMIVLKTHLMSYIENQINDTMPEGSVQDKNSAVEQLRVECIEGAEVKYFPDFDKGQLEQAIIFDQNNGFKYMFSIIWEFDNLIDSDFIEIQEFDI